MAWATEPSPSPAAYPSPNPFYLGNVLSNLVGNYHAQQAAAMALGYLAVQSRPVRVKSCARPLSMRAAMR
jgi:hypothetical protein